MRYISVILLLCFTMAPVFSQESKVSTSLEDAFPVEVWLSGRYSPYAFEIEDRKLKTDMEEEDTEYEVPVTTDALELNPGYYRLQLESFCLHAGTYAPTKGEGYLLAPIKGERGDIVSNILIKSARHNDIPQEDIQTLIWLVELGGSKDDMDEETWNRVSVLLTSAEIERLKAKKTEEVSEKNHVSYKLKSMIRNRSAFVNLRQAAVLQRPKLPARNIAAGQWTYQNGIYVRFFPSGYDTVITEVLVPSHYSIQRDATGRIVFFESDQTRIETSYGESYNVMIRGIPVTIHPFLQIKITNLTSGESETFQNTGWIFDPAQIRTVHIPLTPLTSTKKDLDMETIEKRWAQAKRDLGYAKKAKEIYDRAKGDSKEARDAVEDITDLDHYRKGVESAKNPADLKGKGKWFSDQLGRVKRAWEWAHTMLRPEDKPDSGKRKFSPDGKAIVPADVSSQRLGLGSRRK